MAAHSPNPVRACVFDAYGTLFDFASATRRCRDVLGDSFDKLTALWREKQLQYTWLRAAQGSHADFWQVTGRGGWGLQARSSSLSARGRSAGCSSLADFVSVIERLGCACGVVFWNEGRLVQSVSTAQGTSAG